MQNAVEELQPQSGELVLDEAQNKVVNDAMEIDDVEAGNPQQESVTLDQSGSTASFFRASGPDVSLNLDDLRNTVSHSDHEVTSVLREPTQNADLVSDVVSYALANHAVYSVFRIPRVLFLGLALFILLELSLKVLRSITGQ